MLTAIAWALLGLSSATAVVVGVHRHRPARVGPWLLLAASVLSLSIGDACYDLGASAAASIAYLLVFPLVALCLLLLTRGVAMLVDRAHLIDLLAFSCSALLVTWVFVIGSSSALGRLSPADVLGDLVLVVATGRLIIASERSWSAVLIGVGAAGLLASDVTYPIAPGHYAELGYLVLYLAWGGAALHPSMTRLTDPAPPRSAPFRGRWAALLGVSVATPPTVLAIESVSGGVTDGIAIATAAAITLVLTITRLTDSLDQHSRSLARERGLREASAALVAAADVPAVDAAVRTAVSHLLPADALHKLVFAVDDRGLATSSTPPAGTGAGSRSWWVGDVPVPDGTDAEATLMCPLWLEPLAVARPSGGALVLIGRRGALVATRDACEVLAGQAALALDRIALVDTLGRRDSDQYLRTVIRNTAEVMLVIDEDQHIRYASPAMNTLLGTELSPLATLTDLVHPDDRRQLRAALLAGDDEGAVFCALQRQDGTQVLVEVSYRDLREDRLVRGFVITVRSLADAVVPESERRPHHAPSDNLPGWINRRSASGKFRY